MEQEVANLEILVESILFFKAEPLSYEELARLCNTDEKKIRTAVNRLAETLKSRGIRIVENEREVELRTAKETHETIERMQKETLEGELGKAGLEALAIVLYCEPVTRAEIDYIRGVNSGYTVRNLLVRGLIERANEIGAHGAHRYRATLEALGHLGVTRKEDLPDYETVKVRIAEFTNSVSEHTNP